MRILSLIVIIFFSFVAEAENAEKNIDKFAWYGPKFLEGLSIDQNRDLGVVAKESKEYEVNHFIDNTKTPNYIFIFKDGLEVYCRVVEDHVSGPHVQFTSVHVSSSKWPILYDLNVGQKKSKVVMLLGKPTADENNILRYSGETEEVSFNYNNDLVTRIVFQYYAD
jgi:hypothetical protein